MMHKYYGHYWGMHWFWWVFWIIILLWIFIIPYNIPGQRNKKETPLDIRKKRYAKGEITPQEYEEMKKMLEK